MIRGAWLTEVVRTRRPWLAAWLLVSFALASLAAGQVLSSRAVSPGGPELQPVTIAPMMAQAEVPSLVFASFNVCKTSCTPPAPSWEVRRERVARTIVESGVDVVGLQEVTHHATAAAKTQYLDLVALLRPHGLLPVAYTAGSDACRWTAERPHPCTHTTGLVYRASTVRQVVLPEGQASAGTVPMADISPALTSDAAARKVVWAYLEGAPGDGGAQVEPFLALVVHTSTLKDPGSEASRIAFGRALDGWIQAHNQANGMFGVPVVLMADLNSYRRRQPQGVQQVLVDAGWIDAARAPVQRNTQYSTINVNPLLDVGEQGFPARPYAFRATRLHPQVDATRIDYIMARGNGVSMLDYEVVMHLRADGSFDPQYQGSDHQMIRATIALPAS